MRHSWASKSLISTIEVVPNYNKAFVRRTLRLKRLGAFYDHKTSHLKKKTIDLAFD
jgi:hypothetical protein